MTLFGNILKRMTIHCETCIIAPTYWILNSQKLENLGAIIFKVRAFVHTANKRVYTTYCNYTDTLAVFMYSFPVYSVHAVSSCEFAFFNPPFFYSVKINNKKSKWNILRVIYFLQLICWTIHVFQHNPPIFNITQIVNV